MKVKFIASITKDQLKRNKNYTYLELSLTIPIRSGAFDLDDKARLDQMFMDASVLNVTMEPTNKELWPEPLPAKDPDQKDLQVE